MSHLALVGQVRISHASLASYLYSLWHTTEPADARPPRELQAGRHVGQRREQSEWRRRRQQHRRPLPVFHHCFPALASNAGMEFNLGQPIVARWLIAMRLFDAIGENGR